MTTYDENAKIRALLDERDISDEQRAIEAKKRAILGSSDEAHALTRYERDRGTTDARSITATVGLIVAFSPMFFAHWLGPWKTGGAVIVLAFAWVAVMCCLAGGEER